MLIDLTQPEYVDTYNAIYRSFFEEHGYKNIIIFMIQNHMTDTDEYKEYFKEYLSKAIQYEYDKIAFVHKIKELNPDLEFDRWEILFEKDAVQLE